MDPDPRFNSTPPGQPALPGSLKSALSLSTAAGLVIALCVSSLFFDHLGYLLGLAGLFLLWKRRPVGLAARFGLTAMVILPRATVIWLRPDSERTIFQLETRTFATSLSVWAWSLLLCAFGVWLLVSAKGMRRGAAAAGPGAETKPGGAKAIALLGVGFMIASALMFVGVLDSFQAIEPGEGNTWRLTHLVRGTVATFQPSDVQSITGERSRGSKSTTYRISVRLRDGRSWSMNTGSPLGAEDALKRLAATMDLPAGRMSLHFSPGLGWVNPGRKYRLEEWVGTYRCAANDSVLQLRKNGGRLAGTELVSSGGQQMSRELRNVQFTADGGIEFGAGTLASAKKQAESTYRFSLNFTSRRQAVLRDGFLEVDGTRCERVAAATK